MRIKHILETLLKARYEELKREAARLDAAHAKGQATDADIRASEDRLDRVVRQLAECDDWKP